MKDYKSKTFFETKDCIIKLKTFHDKALIYFANSYWDEIDNCYHEKNNQAKNARSEINKLVHPVSDILESARISPIITYTPPPIIGGPQMRIHAITSIFTAKSYDIGTNDIIDIIERGLAVYEDDKLKSIVRTLNPLNWIFWILNYLVDIPFNILRKYKLIRSDKKDGLIERLFKAITLFLTLITGVYKFLIALDFIK